MSISFRIYGTMLTGAFLLDAEFDDDVLAFFGSCDPLESGLGIANAGGVSDENSRTVRLTLSKFLRSLVASFCSSVRMIHFLSKVISCIPPFFARCGLSLAHVITET